jgi:Protein of unknown function (DUF2934)
MTERTTRSLRGKTSLTAVMRSRFPRFRASLQDARFLSSSPERDAASACSAAPIEPAQRWAMIAEAAYYRSEQRAFAPGHELEDWVEAERESDRDRH